MSVMRSAAVAVGCAAVLVWPSAPPRHAVAGVVHAEAARRGDLWLAPEADLMAARAGLAMAVADLAADRAATALPVFESATKDPVLGAYARLYMGRTQLALKRPADAVATARQLLASSPTGYLTEGALWLAADAASAGSDTQLAVWALLQLAGQPSSVPVEAIQLKLAYALNEAGDRAAALRTFARVYFEFPLSPESKDAAAELTRMAPQTIKPSAATVASILDRGGRLFAARQWADARAAFDSVRAFATGDARLLIDLRLAECDYGLKRYPLALAGLRATLEKQPPVRAAEAEYFYLGTLRETDRRAEYDERLKAFVERADDPLLVQRALNDLAQFHVLANDDAKAAEVFADLYHRYPQGALAERAAWKSGWWAYRTGAYAETIDIFESAAVNLRHADFRPAWLYWAARAHEHLAQVDAAMDGYARAIADYRNTYYGRAAIRAAERIRVALRPDGAGPVSPARLDLPPTVDAGSRPPNAEVIQELLAAGMFDEAIGELRLIQANGTTSPLIDATIAFAFNRQGRLRQGISAMRRAYPQFMAEGGEALPAEILTVIFPVDHWDLIQQYATWASLDPYLLAALIAQESTFQADIRSSANAWGLMQILPTTGRQYAQRLGIRPFTTNRLTNPDVNLKIGTTYFSELVDHFGDVAPALAAYNAGPSRAAQWLAERPGLSREEFIDDIPYPETQNYVKRILGTAEDYRRLYR
jgi:soluble lytic murein transglycosylase